MSVTLSTSPAPCSYEHGKPCRLYSPLGGGLRDVAVYVPPGGETPGDVRWPLIIALHGKMQRPEAFAEQTGLSEPAVNSQYVVAYPLGLNYRWTGDLTAPPRSQVNDIQFVDDLIRYMFANYRIDRERVFLVGYSNGAGLAALIACHPRLSRAVTAVALASASIFLDDVMDEPMFGKFEATKFPIPLLEFHGDADSIIGYNNLMSVDGPSWPLGSWLRNYMWMMEKGLHGHILSEEVEEESLHDGRIERFAWRCGTEEEIVLHYIIHGFGHGWPSTRPLEDESIRHGPTVFDATPMVLEFFEKAARYQTITSDG